MDMTTLGMRFAAGATTTEARSALPDAPVVLEQDVPRRIQRPIAIGPRMALARGLERAAQVIAPPAECGPAH